MRAVIVVNPRFLFRLQFSGKIDKIENFLFGEIPQRKEISSFQPRGDLFFTHGRSIFQI